jgi:hypothetical protein
MHPRPRQARPTTTTLIAALGVSCVIALAVAPAGGAAARSVRVLGLTSSTTRFTPIGFRADGSTPPPVGSRYVVQLSLFNRVSGFGKPAGARVGSVELDCTFTTGRRNLCTGVAHLPDGFFTFTGANRSNGAPVEAYAVTGGVAAYAGRRGQIRAVNSRDGNKAAVTVTLS